MLGFIYSNLRDALRDGFQVYDRTESSILVRRRSRNNGPWELAVVLMQERRHA